MKRYHILHNENWKWVWAQRLGDKLWYHMDGQTHIVDYNEKKIRRDAQKAAIETGEIKAPMPGKIMKVLKGPGQQVKLGETVLVMEAMKMEYALESDVDGQVMSLNVQEGQQVAAGVLLAKIDKFSGEK